MPEPKGLHRQGCHGIREEEWVNKREVGQGRAGEGKEGPLHSFRQFDCPGLSSWLFRPLICVCKMRRLDSQGPTATIIFILIL